jgi:chromate transporter
VAAPAAHQASLPTVLREWGRIGCIGFGGPPAHIALLRRLCVDRGQWLTAAEFEDAVGTCNLLPGPASTQLAIFCAWRVRGRPGAVAGGVAFILPGLAVILALSALFLAGAPPRWVAAAGAGAGAAVAAVAVQAGWSLLVPSWKRAAAPAVAGGTGLAGVTRRARRVRWVIYLLAGGTAAATVGPWLVLVLIGGGLIELAVRHPMKPASPAVLALPAMSVPAAGGLAALAWVAIKVGALSFGGGFVIIPLMRADAVGRHWMTGEQFLNAVALGQITPGPVVQTVAAVGYAAAGVGGGLLAALIAFTPSFVLVLGGARYFSALRGDRRAAAFLDGAGPAAIGAILGSAITLTAALSRPWQYAVLGGAVIVLFGLRRGVVTTLLTAGLAGLLIVQAGGISLPR